MASRFLKIDWWREIVDALEYGYGPLLVSAVMALCITLDPAVEVLLRLAQGVEGTTLQSLTNLLPAVLAVGAWLILPRALFWSLDLAFADRQSYHTRRPWVGQWAEAVLLVLVMLLPLAGGVIGFARAIAEASDVSDNSVAGELPVILLSVVLAIVILQLAILLWTFLVRPAHRAVFARKGAIRRKYCVVRFARRGLSSLEAFRSWTRNPWARLALLLILVLAAVLFAAPRLAVLLGPVPVATIFATLAALVLAGLTWLGSRPNAIGNPPLVFVLIGLALAASGQPAAYFFALVCLIFALLATSMVVRTALLAVTVLFVGYGQLHQRSGACGTPAGCNLLQGVDIAAAPITVRDAAAARGDQNAPLRVIAAQGGGLFSAYQTAIYLAKRSDAERSERFAERVLAISGVSGGSVGAGIYWAIRASGLCEADDPYGPAPSATCYTDAVDDILRHDFLSPAVAGLLYRDMLDTFFPYTVALPMPVDRGRVLERELARRFDAWQRKQAAVLGRAEPQTNPLDMALADSARPGLPLLFLNTTAVADGASVVLSPLASVKGPGADALPMRVPLASGPGRDLTVGTAMVMSARFPIVSPPGRVVAKSGLLQLVDGGYFDNSGIETAVDVITDTDLQLELAKSGQRLQVIAVTVAGDEAARDDDEAEAKGTMAAPVSAFFGAWTARRDLSINRFCAVYEQTREEPAAPAVGAEADKTGVPWRTEIILPPPTPQTLRLPTGWLEEPVRATYAEGDGRPNFTVSWLLARPTFDAIKAEMTAAADNARLGLQQKLLCDGGAAADPALRADLALQPGR